MSDVRRRRRVPRQLTSRKYGLPSLSQSSSLVNSAYGSILVSSPGRFCSCLGISMRSWGQSSSDGAENTGEISMCVALAWWAGDWDRPHTNTPTRRTHLVGSQNLLLVRHDGA